MLYVTGGSLAWQRVQGRETNYVRFTFWVYEFGDSFGLAN